MGIPVDQFMQVSCKFQLTSESECSESVHGNQERVRLCTSAHIENKATLIVMICSNELGNNHIVAYYTERADDHQPNLSRKATNLAKSHELSSQDSQSCDCYQLKASNKRPRAIVRQIYYHNYNEDIVALALSESGNKLALVNASSTIYILPIKNILLDLNSNQSKMPANSKTTHFYDAAIIDCQLDNPISVAYWEDLNASDDPTTPSEGNSMVIVAGQNGELCFISVDEKKLLNTRHFNDKIQSLSIIQDKFTYSLLINCNNFKQFRLPLRLKSDNHRKQAAKSNYSSPRIELPSKRFISPTQSPQSNTSLPSEESDSDQLVDVVPPLEQKPIQIKFSTRNGNKETSSTTSSPIALPHSNGSSGAYPRAAAAILRVLGPSGRFSANKPSLFSALNPVSKDRPITKIFYQSCSSMIGVVDVLGEHKSLVQQASNGIHRFQASIRSNCSSTSSCSTNTSVQASSNQQHFEPRLLRFYPSDQFNYRSHKPILVCRLSLDPDELVKQVVLTDRFLAITTDRDRCLINSRNCCNVKGSSQAKMVELDPLVKEIRFASQEKILTLIKSPISNDRDEIIDSFLLVTTRSVYSIEARQSCRDMFVGLIDSHLGMGKPLEVSRRLSSRQSSQSSLCNSQHQVHCRSKSVAKSKCSSNGQQTSEFSFSDLAYFDQNAFQDAAGRRDSESHLLINNFLNNRDELYERICYDSRAFSAIFKLELGSLFEAYGDKMLLRRHFVLANRFFKMANFSHTRIISKYIRLVAYREMIMIGFRKYAVSALRQHEQQFKALVESHKAIQGAAEVWGRPASEPEAEAERLFSLIQRHQIENIFVDSLEACLAESSDESCKLWFNYINFYLNYVGTRDELQADILRLVSQDQAIEPRIAIALFKAIEADELELGRTPKRLAAHWAALGPARFDHTNSQSPGVEWARPSNLSRLFDNVFLMTLLEKTLGLVQRSDSADLDSLGYLMLARVHSAHESSVAGGGGGGKASGRL